MSSTTPLVDYLVIGSGAMGMAFTDVLMTETAARVAIVDRHHQPGGHWNDAYPFVRLHQPSTFYGVNSRKLGGDTIDATGWNKGLYELATSAEVCAYFDQVMQQQFLASGRVQYFPMCDYQDGVITSRASGMRHEVVAKNIVDATYMNVAVPSQHRPAYEVAAPAHCVPVNALAQLSGEWQRFVVVGAGKTGTDACLFLLKNGVDPQRITWIMPRDSWMFDRAKVQSSALFNQSLGRYFGDVYAALAEATSFDDMFARLDARELLLRFNDAVRPTMWRCSTVTKAELAELRRIKHIVRMGHVQRIDARQITLAKGTVPTDAKTLHVDCSTDGLARRPPVPVFARNRITLQSVRTCQQVFSAAFIAHVEVSYQGEARKNALCTPVPHPDSDIDYLRNTLADMANGARWAQEPVLLKWMQSARLDGYSQPEQRSAPRASAAPSAEMAPAAVAAKLQGFLAAATR